MDHGYTVKDDTNLKKLLLLINHSCAKSYQQGVDNSVEKILNMK